MQSDHHWTHATLRAIRDLTPEVREFLLVPDDGVSAYRPGSHIRVEVQVKGRPDIRHYSLVGRMRPDGWRIAVRRGEPGRGGSHYMWSLQPGARLRVTAPVSRFELGAHRKDVLLLAGGIGITPIYGMAEALLNDGADFALLYAGRSLAQMAYAGDLTALLGDRLKLHPGDRRLDLAAAIADLAPEGELYLCGPIGLLEEARRLWAKAGRPLHRFHFETFGSSGRYPSEPFAVSVPGFNGSIAVPQDGTILTALNQAGIEVLSGCERGECGLCAVTVLEVDGVIDHRDVYFSDAQHNENHKICACVSRVHGKSITLDVGYRPDA